MVWELGDSPYRLCTWPYIDTPRPSITVRLVAYEVPFLVAEKTPEFSTDHSFGHTLPVCKTCRLQNLKFKI